MENELPKFARITVPTQYDESFFTISEEERRKELKDAGKNEKQIDKIISNLRRSVEKGLFTRTSRLNFMVSVLLSHSAQEVYILDRGNLTNEIVSEMPLYLRNRVKLADKDGKIGQRVFDLLEPIRIELNPSWEKLRIEKNLDEGDINGHEHSSCIVNEFLQTLAVAIKYETQADLDLNLTNRAMLRLHKQIKSPEGVSLLSRIDGILNCYKKPPEFTSGLMTIIQPSPSELLEELFDDAKLLSLSKTRYLLGIPSKVQSTNIQIKRQIKEFLSRKKNKEKLEIVRRLGNTATNIFNVEIPELEFPQDVEFMPPLFPLNDIKPKCIGTSRELPTIMPNFFQ